MGRKILFITTDQQRYDALGCNGGTIARTPVVDRLAATGINYRRAHNQNVVCMPARSTMLTGQYVRTHGVLRQRRRAAGRCAERRRVPARGRLPHGAARQGALRAGDRPARQLVREPHGAARARPVRTAASSTWSWRCTCRSGGWHYSVCASSASIPDDAERLRAAALGAQGGGDTGAPEVAYNPIPRECYHTDWVADRTIAWLDSLPADADWFCWMSFPDPHHPWDPPASEAQRVHWRDLDLPPGHPGSRRRRSSRS